MDVKREVQGQVELRKRARLSNVPGYAHDPMTFVNMNKQQKIQATDDPKLEKMIQTLTFDSQANAGEQDSLDIHAIYKLSDKYHSLLGQDQYCNRNCDTIKMSSGSAAINIYKNK
tara:strand:+ start:186 stop:530 length:345 start_codon:yes stop_codon:yes gene_type:complete